MACQAEKDEVRSLEAQIRALQWELTHGHDPDKPALVAEIRRLGRLLSAAKHALEICLTATPDPLPLSTQFVGDAELTTTSGIVSGPYSQKFVAVIVFDGYRQSFSVRSMAVDQISHPLGTTTITLPSSFSGRFDKRTGEMNSSRGSFLIHTDNILVGDSELQIGFTTGGAGALNGKPVDNAGSATWVGSDVIIGGPPQIAGAIASLTLIGLFSPNPLTS